MNKKIEELAADQLIATDSGTHARPEKVEIFERLDGTRYGVETVCDVSSICSAEADSTHGRMRHIQHDSAASRRNQIEIEKAKIEADTKKNTAMESEIERLNRGWDGYQFIGVEAGQAKAKTIAR